MRIKSTNHLRDYAPGTPDTAAGTFIRLLLALILIAGLVIVAFIVYKGSQPMQQGGANGMTYWQFVRERIGVIRELPPKRMIRKVE